MMDKAIEATTHTDMCIGKIRDACTKVPPPRLGDVCCCTCTLVVRPLAPFYPSPSPSPMPPLPTAPPRGATRPASGSSSSPTTVTARPCSPPTASHHAATVPPVCLQRRAITAALPCPPTPLPAPSPARPPWCRGPWLVAALPLWHSGNGRSGHTGTSSYLPTARQAHHVALHLARPVHGGAPARLCPQVQPFGGAPRPSCTEA